MTDDLAEMIADNPAAAWRALDCADARESFADFCGMIEIPGAPVDEDADDESADAQFQPIETPPAAHHKLLISTLEKLEAGTLYGLGQRVRRVMFFLPPGSAKSTYGSVCFPAWFMGRKRRRNVIVATYASDLARKIGRRVRSIIRQPVYSEIFGTGLAADQKAADEWALDNGNEFMGGGILSGITGNRADGIVVDDPVKGRQDADSPQIQKRTKEEFDDSIKTRIKPDAWILLIQTRWSESDLAGQILPEDWDGESGPIKCRDGQVWFVVSIPAEAEANDPLGRKPGEMLWQEWFGAGDAHWSNFRSNARTWSALYQQRPAPNDGTFFKREWFRRYRPADIEGMTFRKYLSSDHAPTDSETSDPSCVRVWGVPPSRDLYLLDGFTHRETMDKTADKVVGNLKDQHRDPSRPVVEGLIRKHKPFAWFPEDDNNWKSAAPFIMRRMREEDVRTRIEPMSPHGGDKASKAQSFQGMAASGRVWIPEGPEGDEIINQYVKFPAGTHDEEVDVAAIIGRAIDMAHPAIVAPAAPDPGPLKGPAEMTLDQLFAAQQPADNRIRF